MSKESLLTLCIFNELESQDQNSFSVAKNSHKARPDQTRAGSQGDVGKRVGMLARKHFLVLITEDESVLPAPCLSV